MKKFLLKIAGRLKRWLEYQLASDNERQFRKQISFLDKQQADAKKRVQDTCHHLAGCNPLSNQEDIFFRTSIVWHTLNTGVEIGICLNCQKEFWPHDSDYAEWRRKVFASLPRRVSWFSLRPTGTGPNPKTYQKTQ